jgi:hypothetical protein
MNVSFLSGDVDIVTTPSTLAGATTIFPQGKIPGLLIINEHNRISAVRPIAP